MEIIDDFLKLPLTERQHREIILNNQIEIIAKIDTLIGLQCAALSEQTEKPVKHWTNLAFDLTQQGIANQFIYLISEFS